MLLCQLDRRVLLPDLPHLPPQAFGKRVQPHPASPAQHVIFIIFLMYVSRKFTFDSAHYLTNYYGKCEKLHGHTYTLEVTLQGEVQSNGLVIDFVVLKRIVKKHVLEKLDHQLLNDVIENPSAELLVVWIWDQLKDLHKLLKEEQDDPNLGEDIKQYFKPDDKESLQKMDFSKTLRLHELKLWETPMACVTFNG